MFAKLFGWRKPVEDQPDDPPSAVRVPVVQQRSVRPAAVKAVAPEKNAKGFDPYNSGAFKRKGAWEKVPRL
ncbi:MAG: hypothetical protein ABW034_16930 [Steroidobacteraceae bacterium]